LDDVKRADAEFAEQTSSKATAPARKPTRFANFKQREHNFSEIERIERAYLELGRDKRVK
ncbi:MAG: hypothetical protein FWE68_06350, partial [Defluviitaleaceae bacterium]|nr:hypothetical protein [Defluviitaleaceae bacterium]